MAVLVPEATLCTDWGAYIRADKSCPMPFDRLAAAGLGIFICKSDEEYPDKGYSSLINLNAARQQSVPIAGTYSFFEPGEDPRYALDRFTRAAEREKPDGIWIDAERMKDSNGNYFPVNQVCDRFQSLYEGLTSRLPEILVDIYSSLGYLLTFVPNLMDWYTPKLPWMAAWPDYGLPSEYSKLAEIVAGNMRQCTNISAPEPRPFVRINVFDGSHGPSFKGLFPDPAKWIWQTTSRERPAEFRFTTYDHQYDFGFANMPVEELKAILKKQDQTDPDDQPIEVKMAEIYNKNVSQADRATIIELSGDIVQADIEKIKTQTDGLLLKMGGADGGPATGRLYRDPYIGSRMLAAVVAKMPVMVYFNLCPGWGPNTQQEQANIAKTAEPGNYDQNQVLVKLLTILRSSAVLPPIDTLTAASGWVNVQALVLHMYSDATEAGGHAGGSWVASCLDTVLRPLMLLQDAGKVPSWPLLVMMPPSLDQQFPELDTYLSHHTDRLSLILNQPTWPTTPGPNLGSLADLFKPENQLRPLDTFKFSWVPSGFGVDPTNARIRAHLFTSGRFAIPEAKDASGQPARIVAGLWCDTKEEMYDFLKFTPGDVPPPVEPPATGRTLEQMDAALAEVERKLVALKGIL